MSADARAAASLIRSGRWAALGTVDGDRPSASMVAYAPSPGLDAVLIFVSGLSAHTRHLLGGGRAALAVSAPDDTRPDPQELARVTLHCRAIPVRRDAPEFDGLWQTYIGRFPAARPRLALADFVLFRLVVEEARFVGGFARAATLSGADLEAAAGELEASEADIDPAGAVTVRAFFEAVADRRWEAAVRLIAADAVIEWPATGERFTGAGFVAMQRAYPEGWRLRILEIAGDDRVGARIRVDQEGAVFLCAGVYDVADGTIRGGVEHWLTVGSEQPPAWRRDYAELRDADDLTASLEPRTD